MLEVRGGIVQIVEVEQVYGYQIPSQCLVQYVYWEKSE